MHTLVRFIQVALATAVVVAVSAALVSTQAPGVLRAGASDTQSLDLAPLSERSVVLARDGTPLALLHAEENRVHVPLDAIPEHTVRAILAVEDEDFYSHSGVNLRAAARALLTNVSAGDVRQGGSTITQQLVKNALLTPDRDLERKVKEAVLALQLEDQMSKDEILERYLNTVYFGNGAYGVQAAAEVYFGVDAEHLDMAQSALLAAVIRNPVGYDPIARPDVARERRDLVAERLVEVGEITPSEAEAITHVPLPTQRVERPKEPVDYFVEEVKQQLLRDPRLGDSAQERYDALFRGGLTIRTTLEPALQKIAEEQVRATLPDTGGEFTAALVSVEPATGAVRALVGGPDFEKAKYNLATQGLGRQPGSSFKPFVLAAALEAGHSPNDRILGSAPCTFRPHDRYPYLIEPWEVDNYEGSRGGVVTLERGTQRSLNCAFARLVLLVGPEKVVDLAKRLGISTTLDPVASIALGAEEVRPIDMAAAYAAFANDGVWHKPFFVEEVTDREGRVVLRGANEGVQAISPQVARVVTQVLEGVISSGTGTRAGFDGHDMAGKTGTTQNWEDAWFVGYTRHLSTAVWMGSPVGKVPMRNVAGIRVTGGSFPARIWRAFMEPAHAFAEHADFLAPEEPLGRGEYLSLPNEGYRSERRYTSRRRRSARRTTTTEASEDVVPDAPSTGGTEAGDPEGTTATTAPSGDGSGDGGADSAGDNAVDGGTDSGTTDTTASDTTSSGGSTGGG